MTKLIHMFMPHSMILILHPDAKDISQSLNHSNLIGATLDCITVNAYSETDGQTLVILTDEADFLEHCGIPLNRVFRGHIRTPNKVVQVVDTSLDALASISTSTTLSRIEVWANDQEEPDTIAVLVAPQDEAQDTIR